MSRTTDRYCSVKILFLLLACSAATTAGDDAGKNETITIGKEFIDNIGNQKTAIPDGEGRAFVYYYEDVPVYLDAGSSISVSATVLGEGRRIVLNLKDPSDDRTIIATSKESLEGAKLSKKQVHMKGIYWIRVASDLQGGFTLLATTGKGVASVQLSPEDANARITALEERVSQLEAEVLLMKKELSRPTRSSP